MDTFWQDAKFALRQLMPAAVGTLAIGIGATVAVFSIVVAVILRPFPFESPDRVVNLHPARNGVPLGVSSNLEFATWRALPRAFDGVAAISSGNPFIMERGDAPQVVNAGRASAELTHVLGISPSLGRAFSPDDDRPGAPHVVILGHKLWLHDYNGDRAVLGQHVRMNGDSYEIIGVMPASLDAVNLGNDLWVPLALSTADLQVFKVRGLQIVARLAPGVSISQATSAVDASERQLATQYPMWGNGYTGQVRRFSDDMVDAFRTRLFVLLGAVSFVFLIACVNVANLLLARGSTRTREISIRTAIGASRSRLIQQLLTESAVLSTVAGALGVGLAYVALRVLVASSPPGVPRIEEARIDWSVLLVALAASALCTVLVGLFPALRTTQPVVSRGRARNVLVGAEVALAMALLTGAGLLIRTAWEISHVDPGFDTGHVLTAQVLLPAHYTAVDYRAIHETIARIPGVQHAALAAYLPLIPPLPSGVGAEGRPFVDGERQLANVHPVSPEYFTTMKMRLLSGRDFMLSDDANAPNVAVINEALARKFWPGESAIGKRMEGMDPSHQHFMVVIGVVADARDVGLEQPAVPEFYIPFEQAPPLLWSGIQGALAIIVRTAPAPAMLDRPLRNAVAAIDPTIPFANVATMDDLVSTSRATARLNTVLLTTLGVIALVLASVGVYGVIAYTVSQRTREIGLRMALGATPPVIAALVVRQGLSPILLGAIAGGALSVVTTRVLREQLYGVGPGDPSTIAAIGVLLLIVSLLAASIPTRRAMSISPVAALKT